MDDLVTWLRAQLDADEQKATAIFRDHTWSAYLEGGADGWAVEGAHSGEPSCLVGDAAMATHIATHDPARVLREVESKRKIINAAVAAWNGSCDPTDDFWVAVAPTLKAVVRNLALPYADRPGYHEEWRP